MCKKGYEVFSILRDEAAPDGGFPARCCLAGAATRNHHTGTPGLEDGVRYGISQALVFCEDRQEWPEPVIVD
ncbi:hypothetical protein CPLU01_13991 [Colletotrichum plurivorum]|uniref:Uncharacterized protein n=1 Tax=Colletotrichum plurivorum TaxID=2175906 RepID=A0A8H6JN30_9PEZI|nr:hypothetical protein CPLU01_13991 [Colletotrichum plurivorum]